MEPEITYLRLAPEWQGFPISIHKTTSEYPDYLSPESLSEEFGISAILAKEIDEWDDEFQDIWDPADPASAEFPSPEARKRWIARGRQLAHQLAGELGHTAQVDYFRETIQPGTASEEQDDD
ncbi:hypothetical protein ABT324_07450 [Saccharopolyspora sp. NPDC000359]|uniref:hypothetical protein n=1 Tax=Saccharopolyspora sp. NPDC000359 TaxID=3154251 RepID=UPI00331E8240